MSDLGFMLVQKSKSSGLQSVVVLMLLPRQFHFFFISHLLLLNNEKTDNVWK